MGIELTKEVLYDLESRKVEEEKKYLLIFDNFMLQKWYERYLNYRNDIIYITYDKIYNNGLVGLRYKNYYFVNNEETKKELEKVLPIIKEC